MNVYDFDKTIYPGDSSLHFWLFCVKRHPRTLLTLPAAGAAALRSLGKTDARTPMKEALFRYLRYIPDPEGEVRAFWDAHIDRIYPWYLRQRREDDLVISASPDFLIGEACRRLRVRCIATQVDVHSGEFTGVNCRGEEKPLRFAREYDTAEIEEFYSDSLSDEPMMALAERAFVTKKGKLTRWQGESRRRETAVR